jgi:hypothetical protein
MSSETDPRPGSPSEPPPPAAPAGSGSSTDHHRRMHEFIETAIETEQAYGWTKETEEQAKRHLVVRLARIIGGSAVALTGIALLFLPGPGLVAIAVGLGIMAPEVPFAARLLERVRERIPQDEEGQLTKGAIVTMSIMGVLGIAAFAGSIVYLIMGLGN